MKRIPLRAQLQPARKRWWEPVDDDGNEGIGPAAVGCMPPTLILIFTAWAFAVFG